ncbi:hypothetical protein LCGC14_0496920 [marine sediment metagenome]|uniref:Uncharacterized protein n=1 Tax=marine sediment metagenome TaxID=412755 RepID=A0A0F9SA60_9ZZZZ
MKIQKRSKRNFLNRERKILIFFLVIQAVIIFGIWIFILKEENIPLIILIFVLSLIGILFLVNYIEKKLKEKERQKRIRRFR